MTALLEYVKSFHLQRAFLYVLIILSSFFVIAPLGDLQMRFQGKCLLYTEFSYNPNSTHHLLEIQFNDSPTLCRYSLAVAALFSLIYAAAAVGFYVYLYIQERQENKLDLAHLLFQLHCLLDLLVCILILVSACTITVGFSAMCSSLLEATGTGTNLHLAGCHSAQKFESWGSYDGSNFHICLSIATAGSWVEFVFWGLQAGLGVWKLWRLNLIPVIPDKMKVCCKKS